MSGQLCHFTNSIWIGSGHSTNIPLVVTLLLDFRYHSLEGGATPDGGKRLRGDAVSNALQALLHERFTLEQTQRNSSVYPPAEPPPPVIPENSKSKQV